jgi:glycosyltransferase involved in cell wall biosynthesis
MRVAINATAGAVLSGIATYVRALVATLPQVDPKNRYCIYAREPIPHDSSLRSSRVDILNTQSPAGLPRLPLAITRALWRNRIDVVHEQVLLPTIAGLPVVVTLHDLIPLHYPDSYGAGYVDQLRRGIPRTVHRAAAIITDSSYSREDILAHFPVSPDKVVSIPLAADPAFQPLHDPGRLLQVRARYGTGDQFVLWTGAPRRYKNLATLIAAYSRLRRSDTTRARLLLAGAARDQLPPDVCTALEASGYADEILLLGSVPAEDLVALYNAAALFVFPSLIEGFGLPPLEAMACGTPVVCANTTALPEVVGDAGVLVDPQDVDQLAGAMARVLADRALQADLGRRGLARATQFSWEATARATRDVYRQVVASRRRKR